MRKLWKLWYLTHFRHHLCELNHTNTCLCHLQFIWAEIQPVNSSVGQMLKLGKVPQPTEFGGKGIKMGHRAVDLSRGHFAAAPILALVILQRFCRNICSCGWKQPGASVCHSTEPLQHQQKSTKLCAVSCCSQGALTPQHRNSSETSSHLSYRESTRVVQLNSTFPRLGSAENCLIIWHLLLDFGALETTYTISLLLSQYRISIKIIATDTTEARSVLRNSRKGDLGYKLCVKM